MRKLFGFVFVAAITASTLAYAADVKPDAEEGAEVADAQNCFGCHVKTGDSGGTIPSLEGWDGESMIDAMRAIKTGEREGIDDAMKSVVMAMDDEEIIHLGAYFDKLSKDAEAAEAAKESKAKQ